MPAEDHEGVSILVSYVEKGGSAIRPRACDRILQGRLVHGCDPVYPRETVASRSQVGILHAFPAVVLDPEDQDPPNPMLHNLRQVAVARSQKRNCRAVTLRVERDAVEDKDRSGGELVVVLY